MTGLLNYLIVTFTKQKSEINYMLYIISNLLYNLFIIIYLI